MPNFAIHRKIKRSQLLLLLLIATLKIKVAREADFINVVIWRQQAENLANWAKKGALIGLLVSIQTRNYENQQGQRVYVTEVVADNFQYWKAITSREGPIFWWLCFQQLRKLIFQFW